MNVNIVIPFCNKGADQDVDKVRSADYRYDIMMAFSGLIIESLGRRMKACQEKLLNHLNDIEYADEMGHIVFRRKDRSHGNFNVSSFKEMQEAIHLLEKQGVRMYYDAFLTKPVYLDQTLKALLNDPELDRSTRKGIRFSELVSLLTEAYFHAGYKSYEKSHKA